MKINLKPSESDPKIVFQLTKQLSLKKELTKESHIIEALYLASRFQIPSATVGVNPKAT